MSDDQLKRNAELKLWIENRIATMQEEMGMLKEALLVVDSSLRASSFRPASEVSSGPTGGGEPIPEIRELKKDKGGETIAVAQITNTKLKIEPVTEVTLKSETPPFKSFLLGKILGGMKATDEAAAKAGSIRKGDELKFSVAEKGGKISSLTIENYREERLSEILSTVAWTLSRMLEK